jgi:hypothetical protein
MIGNHRRASVVHDAACIKKMRSSKLAAEMFYDAMVADGFNKVKAFLYWAAVRYFGPQWNEKTKKAC